MMGRTAFEDDLYTELSICGPVVGSNRDTHLESFVITILGGHAFGILIRNLALREDVSSATRLYDDVVAGNTSAASLMQGARWSN
jgi:hypothetical protein